MKKLNPKVFLEAAEKMHVDYSPFACTAIGIFDNMDAVDYFRELFSPEKREYKLFECFWGSPTNKSTNCRVIALLLCYEMTK